MFNLLIPIAGEAKRFKEKNYHAPKPLIMVKDRMMIDLALDSIDLTEAHIIFCVRKEHVRSFAIDKILKQKYGQDIDIIVVDKLTQGTLCTCLLAENLINNDIPLVIYTPDVEFKPKFDPSQINQDGFLLTFRANNPAHSYLQHNSFGFVCQAAEKEVISNQAAVGVYCFRRGEWFVKYAKETIEKNIKTNGEFYVCPIYNLMIRDGLLVKSQEVEKMFVLGTPEDLDFYIEKTIKVFGEKPIALCGDHSGFELKELSKQILDELGIKWIDFGAHTTTPCDHYEYLLQATQHIQKGLCDFGVGFCRTGGALNIGANKTRGIRSVLVFDEYTAKHARGHNAANFFAMPGHYLNNRDDLKAIFKTLQISTFDGGRHQERIKKLERLENE